MEAGLVGGVVAGLLGGVVAGLAGGVVIGDAVVGDDEEDDDVNMHEPEPAHCHLNQKCLLE